MVDQEEPKEGFIPIEWHCSDKIESKYATNLIVQRAEHEFIISFFEILPPILLGPPEEQSAHLRELDSVRAECVARVIVAADKMPDFVRALHDNLSRTSDDELPGENKE